MTLGYAASLKLQVLIHDMLLVKQWNSISSLDLQARYRISYFSAVKSVMLVLW